MSLVIDSNRIVEAERVSIDGLGGTGDLADRELWNRSQDKSTKSLSLHLCPKPDTWAVPVKEEGEQHGNKPSLFA